jgi:hypothetical protein
MSDHVKEGKPTRELLDANSRATSSGSSSGATYVTR